MNIEQARISGPYTQDNLDVYLVHNAELSNGHGDYVTLEEALDRKKIVVHETGNVGELAVENLFVDHDIYIQAGEIVRGGRQDRTLGVDFVLPAKSKMPIPSFCVEQARWHRRGAEDAGHFSSSKHYISSRELKLASKVHADQGDVWDSVAADQAKLSRSVGESVHSAESASSLELTLEHKKLQEKRSAMVNVLKGLTETHGDAIGFVFAINGEINSAEVYESPVLFRKLWHKLLDSAAVEAVAEQLGQPRTTPTSKPDPVAVRKFLQESDLAEPESRTVTDRVVIRTHHRTNSVLLETRDAARKSEWIHRNYIQTPHDPRRSDRTGQGKNRRSR
jgi:hypothetical protein